MLYSVVDVGSNTVRLVTYKIENNNYLPVYTDYRALGLISEIYDGKLCDSAIDALCDALSDFKKNSPANARFLAFATAFMRAIENADIVIEEVKSRTGISLEVLSGEDEALYSFKGVMRSLNKKSGIVADFGGGSCEFISFDGNFPTNFTSFPFGCVKLAKQFVKNTDFPSHDEMSAMESYVTEMISAEEWITGHDDLILTGGTARAFAQLNNTLSKLNLPLVNYRFTVDSFVKLYDSFTTFKDEYKEIIAKTMPNRLKTIYPGFAAVKAIIEKIGCKRITISTEGVREGYLSKNIRR